jgi:hypothetical protein
LNLGASCAIKLLSSLVKTIKQKEQKTWSQAWVWNHPKLKLGFVIYNQVTLSTKSSS